MKAPDCGCADGKLACTDAQTYRLLSFFLYNLSCFCYQSNGFLNRHISLNLLFLVIAHQLF